MQLKQKSRLFWPWRRANVFFAFPLFLFFLSRHLLFIPIGSAHHYYHLSQYDQRCVSIEWSKHTFVHTHTQRFVISNFHGCQLIKFPCDLPLNYNFKQIILTEFLSFLYFLLGFSCFGTVIILSRTWFTLMLQLLSVTWSIFSAYAQWG